MGDPNLPKQPERIYLSYQHYPTTFNVTAWMDYSQSSVSWVINGTTTYTAGSIMTVSASSSTRISRLRFPPGNKFNHISFQIYGDTYASINDLTMYATPTPLP